MMILIGKLVSFRALNVLSLRVNLLTAGYHLKSKLPYLSKKKKERNGNKNSILS